jgi:hypothetical protein
MDSESRWGWWTGSGLRSRIAIACCLVIVAVGAGSGAVVARHAVSGASEAMPDRTTRPLSKSTTTTTSTAPSTTTSTTTTTTSPPPTTPTPTTEPSSLPGPPSFSAPVNLDPSAVPLSMTMGGISCPPGSTLCVAIDVSNDIYTSTDPAGPWNEQTLSGIRRLDGISCPSANLCVAVDRFGDEAVSTDPGTAGTWQVTNIDGNNEITDVTCTSISFCAAVDGADQVLTTSDPTGGAAAWNVRTVNATVGGLTTIYCTDPSFCVAGGYSDVLVISDDSTGDSSDWSVSLNNLPVPTLQNRQYTYAVTALTCFSASQCLVADSGEQVSASSNFGATSPTWSASAFSTPIYGLYCLPSGYCLALGPTDYYSVDATAPDPQWTSIPDNSSGWPNQSSAWYISCATPTNCEAVGGVVPQAVAVTLP